MESASSNLVPVHRLDSGAGQAAAMRLIRRFSDEVVSCEAAVREILARVRQEGDSAVLEYCRRFDAPDMTAAELKVGAGEFAEAERQVDAGLMASIEAAASRIRRFHERELPDSWMLSQEEGMVTGRLVRPVDAAGLYVPGGREGSTPLVSSVLMTAVPAGIAGVGRLVMVTPPNRQGRVHPALLVAARILGISEVYKLGSAWAVAALAFGTESIQAVDVIAGPGNQFVAEAKRQVMGRVRIDMLAGPSEVLIVADDSANPVFIAADMLAQAEHDPQALPMAIVATPEQAGAVQAELARSFRSWGGKRLPAPRCSPGGIFLSSRTPRPPFTWPTNWPASIWSCICPIHGAGCPGSAMPAPFSWGTTVRRPVATMWPGQTMCCPPWVRRRPPRPWAWRPF